MIIDMMIEPNASIPKRLPLSTYPSNEGMDKNNTYATVPRIMNHHIDIVLDTLPHPTRSSITTVRAFLGADTSQGRPTKSWSEILLIHFPLVLEG